MTSTKFELGDTGTKYQFKYYTVRLVEPNWHHSAGMQVSALDAMLYTDNAIDHWVKTTFGPELDWTNVDRIWWSSSRRYYFLHESDRTLFLLRWE